MQRALFVVMIVGFDFLLGEFVAEQVQQHHHIRLFDDLRLAGFELLERRRPYRPVVLVVFFDGHRLQIEIALELFEQVGALLAGQIDLRLYGIPRCKLGIRQSGGGNQCRIVVRMFALHAVDERDYVSHVPARQIVGVRIVVDGLMPFVGTGYLGDFVTSGVFLPFAPACPETGGLRENLGATTV